jgi:hypothetical protein
VLDEAWRRVSTRPTRENCELKSASAASRQSVGVGICGELELRESYGPFFIVFICLIVLVSYFFAAINRRFYIRNIRCNY